MSGKPIVLLYSQAAAGLIIPWPSGILFQQQTGGFSCLQNCLEGVFVPIDELDGYTKKFEHFFTGPKWRGHCARGIDEETADFIDATLSGAMIRVDRARLTESHEAWVHVFLADPAAIDLEGFAPGGAVLTWPNSD